MMLPEWPSLPNSGQFCECLWYKCLQSWSKGWQGCQCRAGLSSLLAASHSQVPRADEGKAVMGHCWQWERRLEESYREAGAGEQRPGSCSQRPGSGRATRMGGSRWCHVHSVSRSLQPAPLWELTATLDLRRQQRYFLAQALPLHPRPRKRTTHPKQ